MNLYTLGITVLPCESTTQVTEYLIQQKLQEMQ